MKISVLIILVLFLGACAQPPKVIPVENPEEVWKARATYLYSRDVWKASMSVVGATSKEKFKTKSCQITRQIFEHPILCN